jgi:hypothetical protein
MPRQRKNGVNKSAEIRALLEANPKLKTEEIVKTLADRGIQVSGNLVYLVRAKMRSRRRKMKRAAAFDAGVRAGMRDPVQLILKVRALGNEAGGLLKLKQLVDALAG